MNILNPAAFPLDDHHIVDADRLGKGHLDAADQVLERGLGRRAHCQRHQPRRGHQCHPDRPHPRNGEQHESDGEKEDRHLRDTVQDAHPRRAAAGGQIILDADIRMKLDEPPGRRRDAEGQPTRERGERHR